MDQTSMVAEYLTPQMQQDGEILVRALDEIDLRVKAAFWTVKEESGVWRLVVATPFVDEKGPLEAYLQVARALRRKRLTLSAIDSSNLTLVSPRDPLVKLLSEGVGPHSNGSGTRLSRNGINGQFVQDVYIYRLPKVQLR